MIDDLDGIHLDTFSRVYFKLFDRRMELFSVRRQSIVLKAVRRGSLRMKGGVAQSADSHLYPSSQAKEVIRLNPDFYVRDSHLQNHMFTLSDEEITFYIKTANTFEKMFYMQTIAKVYVLVVAIVLFFYSFSYIPFLFILNLCTLTNLVSET